MVQTIINPVTNTYCLYKHTHMVLKKNSYLTFFNHIFFLQIYFKVSEWNFVWHKPVHCHESLQHVHLITLISWDDKRQYLTTYSAQTLDIITQKVGIFWNRYHYIKMLGHLITVHSNLKTRKLVFNTQNQSTKHGNYGIYESYKLTDKRIKFIKWQTITYKRSMSLLSRQSVWNGQKSPCWQWLSSTAVNTSLLLNGLQVNSDRRDGDKHFTQRECEWTAKGHQRGRNCVLDELMHLWPKQNKSPFAFYCLYSKYRCVFAFTCLVSDNQVIIHMLYMW